MASVQGIGGVFIDSADAARLAAWYTDVLGIEFETHPENTSFYRVFFTRDAESSVMRANPVFSINQAEGDLAALGRGFTLNLRVDDIDAVLADLRAKGIEEEGEMIIWAYGKHAWIRDADGNRIELYEEILPEESPA